MLPQLMQLRGTLRAAYGLPVKRCSSLSLLGNAQSSNAQSAAQLCLERIGPHLMLHLSGATAAGLASFMASLVEFVEALTIVLAVGTVRGWRSALLGAGAAVLVLLAMVVALGRSLTTIPIHKLQLVVGSLLLLFGMRWLRKAILRAAGVIALHDETQAYQSQVNTLRGFGAKNKAAFDRLAFATSFKIVMLEGIEVVVIVIGLGSSGALIIPAMLGAGLALLAVAVLGLLLHRPLAKVPENTLKFGVGVMLSAFGSFWVGEAVGIGWPGADAAIVALLFWFFALALLLVAGCRRQHARATLAAPNKSAISNRSAAAKVLAEITALFVDDGRLALGISLWIAALWAIAPALLATQASLVFAVGLGGMLAASALARARYR